MGRGASRRGRRASLKCAQSTGPESQDVHQLLCQVISLRLPRVGVKSSTGSAAARRLRKATTALRALARVAFRELSPW